MTLKEALRGVTRIGVDSSAFIDYGERAPKNIRVLTRIFERLDAGTLEGVTTTLTLTEVLNFARNKPDPAADEPKYRALLDVARRLPVDDAIAMRATDMRQRYGMKTPDAVQLATALEAGCQAFLTINGDDFLRASGEMRVIVPAKLTDA